jgi:hypothetical protein
LGVPHTVVWVGLYSGGNRLRLRLPLTSQNQAPLRGSCPQGVTIPNAAGVSTRSPSQHRARPTRPRPVKQKTPA